MFKKMTVRVLCDDDDDAAGDSDNNDDNDNSNTIIASVTFPYHVYLTKKKNSSRTTIS